MRSGNKYNLAFLAILMGYALYAALFIYRTSFVVDGVRYFSLFDDAMVSMRYARHLAAGLGLVWNPGGPRVEGFTNPLWVGYMALWHLLPLAAAQISLAIQVSGAVFLLLNLVVVRRLGALLAPQAPAVGLGAALLTAFYLPLNNWGLQGMEVSVLALALSGAVWGALRALAAGRVPGSVYLLLGLGTLVRIDLAVPFLAILGFLAVVDHANRGRHLLVGGAILAAFLAGQTACRLWYYGAPLPNTYYLKMTGYPTGLRIQQGIAVFASFVWQMNPLVFLLGPAVYLRRREPAVLLLGWVGVAQAAYSIYVGGDAWERWGGSNRYLSITMPLFLVLLAYSLWQIAAGLRARLAVAPPAGRGCLLALVGVGLVGLGAFAAASYVGWDRALPVAGGALGIGLALAGLGMGWGMGLGSARLGKGAGRVGWLILLALVLTNLNAIHSPGAADEWLLREPPLHVTDNQAGVTQAAAIQRFTTPQAKVAVVWAGGIPYFTERPMVDLLGKNDPVIAREAARPPAGSPVYLNFIPGHMKWDYAHSLGQEQPDLVVQLWAGFGKGSALKLKFIPDDAAPYLDAAYTRVRLYGFVYYVRNGSPAIRWDIVNRDNDE